jgi:hypothetical protein
MINEDIIKIFISRDENREPILVVDTDDLYICMLCPDWVGLEKDALIHQEQHPESNCEICNRRVYQASIDENYTNSFRVCVNCKEIVEASLKTWKGKIYNLYYTIQEKRGKIKKEDFYE